jgi:hypothetical protein
MTTAARPNRRLGYMQSGCLYYTPRRLVLTLSAETYEKENSGAGSASKPCIYLRPSRRLRSFSSREIHPRKVAANSHVQQALASIS